MITERIRIAGCTRTYQNVTNRVGTFAPLRERTFRTIWTASLLSNFGQLILGVGAAWEMTRMSSSASMVALVQTAMMVPLMLVAVPAGAVADMFDRRKIAMTGLAFSMLSSAALTALAFLGLTTPWLLLGFCALIGSGVALYGPAWQASISEQVEAAHLPAAVALGTISYNVARSFGPALGGLIVLAAGAKAAFAINAVSYLPLFIAFALWRRKHMPSRLPPERIDRAIVSGGRYALNSSPVRKVLVRAFVFGLASASSIALGALIARVLLHGNASTFGLLLGVVGVGAVGGALLVNGVRDRLGAENGVRLCAAISAVMMIVTGTSTHLALTCAAMFIGGGSNIMTMAMLNVSVQMAVPRWVTARALSLFQSALTGGIAIGSVIWGLVAKSHGVDVALIASGFTLLLTPVIGFVLPLAGAEHHGLAEVDIGNDLDDALGLNLRSGPISIAIDYRVQATQARAFYDVMRLVQRSRMRNGGFNWSIARDIADPELWTERYHCPTWGEYQRMRSRYTQADRAAQAAADTFNLMADGPRVRRRLERPFGSVRWQADSPDPQQTDMGFLAP
jgi:MFS family permease